MSNNTTIEVLSSVMGSGKTSFLIERMKRAERPIIYIAPYLEECHRVAEACAGCAARGSGVDFHEPSDKKDGVPFANYSGNGSKTAHLRKLLQAGKSVTATHALFHHLRRDMLQAIQMHGYTLVMDEVISVANTIGVTADQFQQLVADDVLREGPVKSLAKWVCQVYPGENTSRNGEKLGKHLTIGQLHQRAKAGRLMTVDGSIVFWMFPLNFFQAFESVTVATYLFEGSHLRRYYDLHDLDYRVRAVTKRDGRYTLIRPEDFDMSDYLAKMRRLIQIVDDPNLSSVGGPDGSLSYTWYMGGKKGNAKQRDDRIKLVQTGLNRLLNRVVGKEWNKKKHFMFTSFKEVSILPDDGKHPKHPLLSDIQRVPAECFLAHNIKATNKFIGKKTVAYLVNRFMNPFMVRGFEKAGVEINEGHFALSEMLQFIYRSRIRKGWGIKLWVPSARMRGLLESWLAGEIQ